MVNLFTALKPLLHGLTKLAGLTPQKVEIEPGTIMNIWVPKRTINRSSTKNQGQKWEKPNKPVVVLAHPFSEDGIQMWFFQIQALTSKYSVYVPDFLFFGGSTTTRAERTPDFQAECLAKCLIVLGVETCTLVGLSYGGMVGFKMAKLYPDLVRDMVVSSTVIDMTKSIEGASLAGFGFSRWSELLLPETVEGVELLLKLITHKLPSWLPSFFYRDFLEAMFDNRKEKSELLEALVVSDEDSTIPDYPQRIHFLWGDDDKIFNLELANNMNWEISLNYREIGENATLTYIKNGVHLVQLERPCAYNRELKRILASLNEDEI